MWRFVGERDGELSLIVDDEFQSTPVAELGSNTLILDRGLLGLAGLAAYRKPGQD